MAQELSAEAENDSPSPVGANGSWPDQTTSAPWAHGGFKMRALVARLKVPASESQLSLALALSVLVMAGLLWAILWQSNIIVQQREAIRYLWSLHGGHIG